MTKGRGFAPFAAPTARQAAGFPTSLRDVLITGAGPVRHSSHRIQNGALERSARSVQGDRELAAVTGQEFAKLTHVRVVLPGRRRDGGSHVPRAPAGRSLRTPLVTKQDGGETLIGTQQFEAANRGNPSVQKRRTRVQHGSGFYLWAGAGSRSERPLLRYAAGRKTVLPSPARPVSAVLFDWDGTLANSFATTRYASLSVFGHFGIRMNEARYQATYQPNWHETYRQLGIPEDRWDEAGAIWRERYLERSHAVDLFPDVLDALAMLAERGLQLGVVTSADRQRFFEDLGRLELADRFGVLVAFEDTRNKKPHPEGLLLALSRLGVEPRDALYVGDRPEDIAMGKRAGTLTAAVVSNFSSEKMLRSAGPDFLLEALRDLPGALLGTASEP